MYLYQVKSKKCHKMPPKKRACHADKPRTPITIIRLEGLKCQEESAGMVQTQCNAGVMRSTALSGSGLKNYKADAEPGYVGESDRGKGTV